jgi:peptidoglycan hydrolase-like protein with peptidoglycan-binding domain
MRDVIDDEGRRFGPASLFALLATGLIAVSILYNAMFGQGSRRLASLPEGGTTRVVVDAGTDNSTIVRLRYDPIVEHVQRELQAAGFYKGEIDGVAGKRTRLAIEAYQKAVGIAVTGEASSGLAEHIRFTREVAEASLFTGSVEADPEAEAKARIRRVQTGLAELGYQPGDIDGELTAATRQAIADFEHDRGMVESGQISDDLLHELAKMSGQSEIAAD